MLDYQAVTHVCVAYKILLITYNAIALQQQ